MLIIRETGREEERYIGILWKKKVHRSEVLLVGNNVLITELTTGLPDSEYYQRSVFLGFDLVGYNLAMKNCHGAWFLVFVGYYSLCILLLHFGHSLHRLSEGNIFMSLTNLLKQDHIPWNRGTLFWLPSALYLWGYFTKVFEIPWICHL